MDCRLYRPLCLLKSRTITFLIVKSIDTAANSGNILCSGELKMKSYSIVILLVTARLLMVSTAAIAHHGTGISYDLSKLVSVKGVVVKFAWSNRHSQLYFDVTDAKAEVG